MYHVMLRAKTILRMATDTLLLALQYLDHEHTMCMAFTPGIQFFGVTPHHSERQLLLLSHFSCPKALHSNRPDNLVPVNKESTISTFQHSPALSKNRTTVIVEAFVSDLTNTSLSHPHFFASHTFNNLPPNIRSINTLPEFKRKAQQHILSYSCPCSRHLN